MVAEYFQAIEASDINFNDVGGMNELKEDQALTTYQ